MKVVVIDHHGGPGVLATRESPRPVAGPGEVLVRVTHVGLNHLDTWVRRGVPGHDFHLPRVPGSDVAGTVDGRPVVLHPCWGCGTCRACLAGNQNRCRDFKIRGENADGGCQPWLAVPAWQCLPVPAGLELAGAASMPLALLTAWHMLHRRARVQRGERVLVQAGASGVGVMAIQLARAHGCEVHATASTAAKREAVARLGATPWSYDEVGVRNVDVVVDSVGAPTWGASTRALRWGGRLVCCGATGGHEVALDLRALFFKQVDVLGSTMGTSADMVDAWAAVGRGEVRPVVHAVLPLSRLGEAHEMLENREVVGKLVVTVDDE